ncbi:DNA repair protein RecO [Patescibacteria group bacterium]
MVASRTYIAEGIVIKRINFHEADKIVTIFTKRYGKKRVLAKGIRKINSKRGPHLELFRKVNITIYKRDTLDIVTDAIGKDIMFSSNSKLEKYGFMYFVCELVDKLIASDEEQDEIYDLFLQAIADLSKSKKTREAVLIVTNFVNSKLVILGYLSPDNKLEPNQITKYVESIVEKKLHVPQFLHAIFDKK